MPDQIELTFVLRPPAASQAISEQLLAGTYQTSELNRSDIEADPADIQAVTQFAASHNLKVGKSDPTARSIKVAGSAADIEKAFGIRSDDAQQGTVKTLNYKGPINLPAPLNSIVIAVLGLDHTPIARHHAQ